MKNVFLVMAVLSAFVLPAMGGYIEFVENGSFESGQAIGTGWGTWGTLADGWTYVQGDGQLRAVGGSGSPWWGRVAYDEDVFISVSTNAGNTSIIEQQLKDLVIGEQYAVNFAATLGPGDVGSSNLKVYIGTTLVYDVNMARFGWYTTGNTWTEQSYTANLTDGSDPVLRFVHTNGTENNHRMLFDSVSVYGVPEPTTMLLLGIGGLLLRKRRK